MYTEQHLRALSVVAAALAAYFITLRDRAELTQLARERDEARRAAERADRAKDDLLQLLLREVKAPLDAVLACGRVLRAAIDDLPARTQRNRRARTHRAGAGRASSRGFSTDVGRAGGASSRRARPAAAVRRARRRQPAGGIRVLVVEHDSGSAKRSRRRWIITAPWSPRSARRPRRWRTLNECGRTCCCSAIFRRAVTARRS